MKFKVGAILIAKNTTIVAFRKVVSVDNKLNKYVLIDPEELKSRKRELDASYVENMYRIHTKLEQILK